MDTDAFLPLKRFFEKYKLHTYKKRDVILHEDDMSSGVYYIKSGFLRLYSVSKDGEELTRIILGPNDQFPIRWAVSNAPIDYYVESMGQTVEAWRCSRNEFLDFIKANPDIMYEVLRRMLLRMGSLYIRMEYLVFGNAYQKIASILLILSRKFGKEENVGTLIQVPLTHKDIAALVGVARETASIEIERLEKEGFIERRGHSITIKNVQKLREKSMLTT